MKRKYVFLNMARSFTLVEMMLIVTLIAAIVLIAVPHLLRMRVNANEAAARTTLKSISSACEAYASNNNGRYPGSMNDLLNAVPAYINEDYTASARQGYYFNCSNQLNEAGYNCTAKPVTCAVSGTKIFRIISGGILSEEDCSAS